MKYVVVCYAVHKRAIASWDVFDDEDDAYAFLKQDAESTYEDEREGSNNECTEFDCSDGKAYLLSYDGEFEWTWEVISVR